MRDIGTAVFDKVVLVALAAALSACRCPREAACADAEPGFFAIFNGRDLSGWEGGTNAYYVTANGELSCTSASSVGGMSLRNLWTARDYTNFVIRFSVVLPQNANNGLGIRTAPGGWCSREGMEIQLLDDYGDAYNGTNKLTNLHYSGAIYGVVGPALGVNGKSYLRSPGEWNDFEVTANGSRITVVLNGVTVVDDDVSKYSTDGGEDGTKRPGLHNKSGRIHWCGHGNDVRWRDIRIKELP